MRHAHGIARVQALVALAAAAILVTACNGRLGTARPDPIGPLRAQFDAADSNGDELLDRDEVAAGMPKLLDAFDTIDTDGNGLISPAELGSYLQWQRVLRRRPGEPMDLPRR
jgi:Ca2+-binding EF-hand superfamily protein